MKSTAREDWLVSKQLTNWVIIQLMTTRWIWRRRQTLPPAPPVKSRTSPEVFDSNVAKARAAIAAASDEDLFKPWTLMSNGKEILTLPKVAVLRSFVMNHNIHHRAQLGVYLRLNDIPVPSIYGPSADENPF